MPHRYLSIHAHFYQPPREDPFTGNIPNETGAAPFHNWNERIHAECYRPNADLRNFEQISFNIGPTLSTWLAQNAPLTLQNIVEQDHHNVLRYGIGNAMAQAYNHTILPLASRQDKITQIYWGVAEFERRFGRRPQGMWLPETAVDSETLEVLAENGIKFTILAPWQAAAPDLDTSQPYRVELPGDRNIAVFFYDRDLSARISFDPGATINADLFVKDILIPRFAPEVIHSSEDRLVLVASDGELYGHHQRLRERFLARLVDGASSSSGIQPVFPALWLKHHPPRRTIRIRERTSWSCHHGVGRWNGECPCTPGDGKWKRNLRRAFDRLTVALDEVYLEIASRYVPDPWELRNHYIHVLLGTTNLADLVADLSGHGLNEPQLKRLGLMLESQRERQRMYTSCGWFFDDFDRIEPKNDVAYAAQAVRLAQVASGKDLSTAILADLDSVVSPRTRLRASRLFQHQLHRAENKA
jgi:alpha-amylase/alpha-mannosidase (GH57 family)